MKYINQKIIEIIFKAANGNLSVEEMENVMVTLPVKDGREFLKLIRMLKIMHDCSNLLEIPENEMPI